MARYGSLRASDADREAVTARLGDAASEGRLDPDELEERVEAALRARTYRDLSRLVADLPGERGRPGQRATSLLGPLVRFALVATVVLVAAMIVVAVVAMLLLAATMWWIGCLVVWLVWCRSRRRFAAASARVHHTRPAGLL
jgi:Flp pilus assembly protein TadB